MIGFFCDSKFIRNFFSPLVNGISDRKFVIERINLPRILSALLLSLFTAPTLNAAPPGSTPPTHYSALPRGLSYPAFTGFTPDITAQAAASYWNSLNGSRKYENLRTCSVYTPMLGYASYLCPFDQCDYTSLGKFCDFNPYGIEVWPQCGPSNGAPWDGTEFYCPPEPECPAH